MQSFNLIFSLAFSLSVSSPIRPTPRLMPFHFLCFTAPAKYKIYVLFTFKIYSDLIENFFRSPSQSLLLPFSIFYFGKKGGKLIKRE